MITNQLTPNDVDGLKDTLLELDEAETAAKEFLTLPEVTITIRSKLEQTLTELGREKERIQSVLLNHRRDRYEQTRELVTA